MNKFAVGTMVAAVLALLGVGVNAAYESHQTNKKIGKAAEELKNASIKDISDGLLQEAVTRAADLAVDRYIKTDNDAILSKAMTRLGNEVSSLVNSRYNDVTKDVSDRIAKHVADLDHPDRIRRAVMEKAEQILLDRFDDDLDDLKEKAKDAFDDANDRYEEKLEDLSDKFESKLDDKLEDYSEHLATMKKLSDVIENAFSGRKGDREGKEIRFTLG